MATASNSKEKGMPFPSMQEVIYIYLLIFLSKMVEDTSTYLIMSELARHASEIKKNDAMNLIGYQVLEIESSHHHACTPHAGHRSSKSSSHIGHESCPKQVKAEISHTMGPWMHSMVILMVSLSKYLFVR